MSIAAITKLSPTHSLSDAFELLDTEGVFIIENAINSNMLATLRQELQPYLNQTNFCEGKFFGTNTKRVNALANKSFTCQQLMLSNSVLTLAMHVLAPYCSSLQLSVTQAVQICPGEKAQIIHRDSSMWPMLARMPMPFEALLSTIWSYDDFTAKNGATIVVPGSHKWSKERRPFREEIVQAEMSAGSVLIYVGNLLHGGGANLSNNSRTGILISYCLGWLRQFENFYLESPPDIAKNYPKNLRELMGYSIHKPDLGLYEGNDPEILFSGQGGEENTSKDHMSVEQGVLLDKLIKLQPSME